MKNVFIPTKDKCFVIIETVKDIKTVDSPVYKLLLYYSKIAKDQFYMLLYLLKRGLNIFTSFKL